MAMIENEVEKKVYKVEDVQNLLGWDAPWRMNL